MSSFQHQDAIGAERERIDLSIAGFIYGFCLGVGAGLALGLFFA